MGFGEIILIFLIAAVAIIVTFLIFGGWLLVNGVRLTSRAVGHLLLGGAGGNPRRSLPHGRPLGVATLRCPRQGCHAENQVAARFCRRCGATMDARAAVGRQQVAVRRAAAG